MSELPENYGGDFGGSVGVDGGAVEVLTEGRDESGDVPQVVETPDGGSTADLSGRESSSDLGTMTPEAFYPALEQRVASDPKGARTRRWLEEAKTRMRRQLDAVGLQSKSFAFQMQGGKLSIWLTFVRENWSRLAQRPSWLTAKVGQEGDDVVHACVGDDMAGEESRSIIRAEVMSRIAAVTAEIEAITALLQNKGSDKGKDNI
jgi:hypothetical protein